MPGPASYPGRQLVEEATLELVRVRPGRRPTVGEVASRLGLRPRQLRRAQVRLGLPPVRQLIVLSAVTVAAELIRDGIKIEAAISMTGFKNRTNFYRQFRRYFQKLPSADCGSRRS